jgi:hypothetical protein
MLGLVLNAAWLLARKSHGSKGYLARNISEPHTLKLSPHEQLAFALGFENLNPPATMALE